MVDIRVSELEEIYKNNTLTDAAKKLGISRSTFLRLLKESGIKRKGKGNRSATGGKPRIRLIDDRVKGGINER